MLRHVRKWRTLLLAIRMAFQVHPADEKIIITKTIEYMRKYILACLTLATMLSVAAVQGLNPGGPVALRTGGHASATPSVQTDGNTLKTDAPSYDVTVTEDWEVGNENYWNYTDKTVQSVYKWHFVNAGLFAQQGNDHVNGEMACRFGKNSNSSITMLEDVHGVSGIMFYAATYGTTEADATIELQYSVDGGDTWAVIDDIQLTHEFLQYTYRQDFGGDVRFKFQQTKGARLNIDDITICFQEEEFDDDDIAILSEFYDQYQNDGFAWDLSDPAGLLDEIPSDYGGFSQIVLDQEGRVSEVHLESCGLQGEFPVMLLSLDHLRVLNLNSNMLDGDAAAAVQQYLELHPDITSHIQELHISNNAFEGNLGALAASFGEIKYLEAVFNHFTEVTPRVDPSVELFYDVQQLSMDLDFTGGPEAFIAAVPPICFYNHNWWDVESGQEEPYCHLIRIELSGIGNILIDKDSCSSKIDGYINLWSGFENEKAYEATSHMLRYWDDDYWYGNDQLLTGTIRYLMGDANLDCVVDVTDLQTIINYILLADYPGICAPAVNHNADARINVQDVIGEVDVLLSQQLDTRCNAPSFASGSMSNETAASASLYWRDGVLYLSTPVAVSALDIVNQADGDIRWNNEALGLIVSTARDGDTEHAVMYSLGHAVIPPGVTAIASTTSRASNVVACRLSDLRAVRVPVMLSGGTDALPEVKADAVDCQWNGHELMVTSGRELDDVDVVVYTIDGRETLRCHLPRLVSGTSIIDMDPINGKQGYHIIVVKSAGQVIATQKITQIR